MYMKKITTLVAAVLLMGFVLPGDVFAQSVNNTESLNAKIESLLKTITQMREQVGQLQQKKASVGVSQNETNDSSTISSTDISKQGLCGIGSIVRDIRVGDSDSKLNKGNIVRSMQEYLRSEGYFTYPTSTGYFGSITESALKNWQKANNISSSENGRVGSETLERIQKSKCFVPAPPMPSSEVYMNLDKNVYSPGDTVKVTLSYSNKGSSEQKVLDFNSGCHVYVTAVAGYFAQSDGIRVIPWSYDSRKTEMCSQQLTTVVIGAGEIKTWTKKFVVPSDARGSLSVSGGFYGDTIKATFGTVTAIIKPTDTEKKSITISEIEGPNLVIVGSQNSWKFKISAPLGTRLSYSINWGDEISINSGLSKVMMPMIYMTSSTVEMQHSYNTAGKYTIRITATDVENPTNTNTASVTVQVTSPQTCSTGICQW